MGRALLLILIVVGLAAVAQGIIHEVTPDTWADVVRGCGRPAVVLFYAPWCPHCEECMPNLQAVSKDLEGKVTFAKLDADEYRDFGHKYGIHSYPIVLGFPTTGKRFYKYTGTKDECGLHDFALTMMNPL